MLQLKNNLMFYTPVPFKTDQKIHMYFPKVQNPCQTACFYLAVDMSIKQIIANKS